MHSCYTSKEGEIGTWTWELEELPAKDVFNVSIPPLPSDWSCNGSYNDTDFNNYQMTQLYLNFFLIQ